MLLRLWKEGLGTPTQIAMMPSDEVLTAWQYVQFCDEYLETSIELAKEPA